MILKTGAERIIKVVRKHQQIDIPHLWKVFLQPDHFARQLYEGVNAPLEIIDRLVDQELDRLPTVEGSSV